VPVKVITCGLSASLSKTWTLALMVPVTVGENVTVTEQLAPTAKLVPQVLLCV
jgi:antitoxin (DNA-binding transcriptional repressor) of toxin-antitoxin stability system